MILETERTIIRNFEITDLEDLHEIFGDKEVMTNIEEAYSKEKTNDFLESFCAGQNGALACVHKDTNKMIGYILFNEYEEDVYEMGWIFNKDCWRQGNGIERK
ncbi:MAG: GNAT family N-acetyltransferase [Tissierellia bacterium]|nr:GNAT family N-acetyltransferase [Tissierellia bacterium]